MLSRLKCLGFVPRLVNALLDSQTFGLNQIWEEICPPLIAAFVVNPLLQAICCMFVATLSPKRNIPIPWVKCFSPWLTFFVVSFCCFCVKQPSSVVEYIFSSPPPNTQTPQTCSTRYFQGFCKRANHRVQSPHMPGSLFVTGGEGGGAFSSIPDC